MLVAGDGDYSPLVQRLREFGKRVVGVGTKASASAWGRATCQTPRDCAGESPVRAVRCYESAGER